MGKKLSRRTGNATSQEFRMPVNEAVGTKREISDEQRTQATGGRSELVRSGQSCRTEACLFPGAIVAIDRFRVKRLNIVFVVTFID